MPSSTTKTEDERGRLSREPITLVGLVLESASGLRRELAPSMEIATGVTGLAFEVLVRLNRSPGGALRMSDLAAQTGLTRSGLTRALDRLVEAKLCARANCDLDRRGTYAVLTDEGRIRVEEAIKSHERDITELLAGLFTVAEETELVEFLRKIRDRVNPNAAFVSSDLSISDCSELDS